MKFLKRSQRSTNAYGLLPRCPTSAQPWTFSGVRWLDPAVSSAALSLSALHSFHSRLVFGPTTPQQFFGNRHRRLLPHHCLLHHASIISTTNTTIHFPSPPAAADAATLPPTALLLPSVRLRHPLCQTSSGGRTSIPFQCLVAYPFLWPRFLATLEHWAAQKEKNKIPQLTPPSSFSSSFVFPSSPLTPVHFSFEELSSLALTAVFPFPPQRFCSGISKYFLWRLPCSTVLRVAASWYPVASSRPLCRAKPRFFPSNRRWPVFLAQLSFGIPYECVWYRGSASSLLSFAPSARTSR